MKSTSLQSFLVNWVIRTWSFLFVISLSQLQAQEASPSENMEDIYEKIWHETLKNEGSKSSITVAKKLISGDNTISFLDSMALELEISNIYHSIKPKPDSLGLTYLPFKYGMIGYLNLKKAGALNDDGILTIIDYTLPSSAKRFFCIDLKSRGFYFYTYVSHGKNSGDDVAVRFSNKPQSLQSSFGFYVTGETYVGSKGYSLRLDGIEKGVNDNMRQRAVVMHSAPYVSENFIRNYGRLGRSYGCPVVPEHLHKEIIEKIKDGTLIFGYYRDEKYLGTSTILKIDNLLSR